MPCNKNNNLARKGNKAMSTSNFYNHENGIFTLYQPTYKETINEIVECWEIEKEDITEEIIYDYQNSILEMEIECFKDNLQYLLDKYGYYIVETQKYSYEVYNKASKIIAKIYFENGYYSGVQVIVETSPDELISYEYWNTKAELYEQYSPYHERLLQAVGKLTKHLGIYARFSNGETWYSEI